MQWSLRLCCQFWWEVFYILCMIHITELCELTSPTYADAPYLELIILFLIIVRPEPGWFDQSDLHRGGFYYPQRPMQQCFIGLPLGPRCGAHLSNRRHHRSGYHNSPGHGIGFANTWHHAYGIVWFWRLLSRAGFRTGEYYRRYGIGNSALYRPAQWVSTVIAGAKDVYRSHIL